MRSMVEGAPRPPLYPFHDGRRVPQDVARWNSKNCQAALAQVSVPRLVAPALRGIVMRRAVNLDRECRFAAIEIGDVGLDRMLTAKLQSAGPMAQLLP